MPIIRRLHFVPELFLAFLLTFMFGDAVCAPSDAVVKSQCKKEAIPIGSVPTKEFNSASAECGSIDDVYSMNAWEVTTVYDGVVTCELPDYLKGYPPNIAYRPANHVLSDNCPPLIHGGPNAFVLKPLEPLEPRTVKKAFESADYAIALPFCYGRSSIEDQFLQSSVLADGPVVPPSDVPDASTDKYVVKRLFFTRFCAPDPLERPNAIVITSFPYAQSPEVLKGKLLFACAISLPNPIPQVWSHRIRRAHDDRCGSENGQNSVWVSWPDK